MGCPSFRPGSGFATMIGVPIGRASVTPQAMWSFLTRGLLAPWVKWCMQLRVGKRAAARITASTWTTAPRPWRRSSERPAAFNPSPTLPALNRPLPRWPTQMISAILPHQRRNDYLDGPHSPQAQLQKVTFRSGSTLTTTYAAAERRTGRRGVHGRVAAKGNPATLVAPRHSGFG